jgi:nucleotide-binding universal stress UspA family protein
MSASATKKRLLIAVETAALAEPALVSASALGSNKVDLLHVWEPIPFTPPDAAFYQATGTESYRHMAITHGEHELRKAAEKAGELGLSVDRQLVREGAPAQTICEVAAELGSEVVVTTNHQRHGVGRWLQGSVSTRVAQLSECPVLVVPAG